MDPITITLIVSTVVTTGTTIHQHYQKKRAQEQSNRASREAETAAQRAREANEAQLKQFFIALEERSKTLKLLIDKAIETANIDDIQEYCFWSSAISELTRINKENEEAQTIEDIPKADQTFLENLGKYQNDELSKEASANFRKKVIKKHEYDVLKYLYELTRSKLKFQKEEMKRLRKEKVNLKTELDSLKSRQKVEGKDVSDTIRHKEGELKIIEGTLETIPGIMKKVEFLLVCLYKVVSAGMKEIEEDPELKRAYNLLLKYLSQEALTDEDFKFLNLFVLKYKPDIAA